MNSKNKINKVWRCQYCREVDTIIPVFSSCVFDEDGDIEQAEILHYECIECGELENELEEIATWEEV